MPVDEATKKKIDDWIDKTGRNEFGDPPGTVYAGGNPLFNEMRPGPMQDRYEYIWSRHADQIRDETRDDDQAAAV